MNYITSGSHTQHNGNLVIGSWNHSNYVKHFHCVIQIRPGAKRKHREASDFYGSHKSGNETLKTEAN